MKKILVPTDFSDTANKARDYAVQLAKELKAEVTLLNIYHIPITVAHPDIHVDIGEIAKGAEQRIKE